MEVRISLIINAGHRLPFELRCVSFSNVAFLIHLDLFTAKFDIFYSVVLEDFLEMSNKQQQEVP